MSREEEPRSPTTPASASESDSTPSSSRPAAKSGGLSRRSFLQWSAMASAASSFAGARTQEGDGRGVVVLKSRHGTGASFIWEFTDEKAEPNASLANGT